MSGKVVLFRLPVLWIQQRGGRFLTFMLNISFARPALVPLFLACSERHQMSSLERGWLSGAKSGE